MFRILGTPNFARGGRNFAKQVVFARNIGFSVRKETVSDCLSKVYGLLHRVCGLLLRVYGFDFRVYGLLLRVFGCLVRV